MARARNIKPSFFINEHLVDLDPIYRLLFIGLWTLADREGRIENRPKKIKMELFPADNIDITVGLSDLCKTGFIQLYNCYETNVIQIINFSKHQKPHGLEKDSDLPNTDGLFTIYPRNEKNKTVNGDGVFHNYESWCNVKGIDFNQQLIQNQDNNCLKTVLEQDNNALNPECGILNPDILNDESKDIPSDKPKKSKSVLKLIPSDFEISERVRVWAMKDNHQNLELHLERFKETALMKNYKYADWDLAFMKAVREDWGKVNKPTFINNSYQQPQNTFNKLGVMADEWDERNAINTPY